MTAASAYMGSIPVMPGLCQIDAVDGTMSGRTGIKRSRIRDLHGLYADGAAFDRLASARGEDIAYEVQEFRPGRVAPHELVFGTSTLQPGKVGNEYFMTRGHIHAELDRPEIYYCLRGHGVMHMETLAGETHPVETTPGAVVHVPPRWIHRSVNVGAEPLVTLFCYPADAGQDYAIIERARGMRTLIMDDGGGGWREIDNPRYRPRSADEQQRYLQGALRMAADSDNALLTPADVPTIYFVGVTTGRSAILGVFPKWARALKLGPCRIVGVDLPLHAPAEDYRRVVRFIKDDPLCRGALVTTHKIDLFAACRDLFDRIDPLADLMGELSCLSKKDGQLVATAIDPVSSRLALQAFLAKGHFARSGGELFSMGAGGSTIAITWNLMQKSRGEDRPARIVVSNRSQPRLDSIMRIHRSFGADMPVEYVLAPSPEHNDRVMAGLAPGSLAVNATGLGKDAPGSPITDKAKFPDGGFAWELNYRGNLVFLRQAQAAAARQRLGIEHGWTYFLHGWTRVIAEVFDVAIPTEGPVFDRLSELAGGPPLLERAS